MPRAKKTITSEENYNMPFPRRLRGLLERPDETQDKLAKAIGVNRQSIGQWKDGITSPDINALNKIADYYKVSTDYLLGRIDLKSPEVDNMAIHDKIGLSDESIEILGKRYKYWPDNSKTRVLNVLLKDNKVLYSIEKYLFCTLEKPVLIELKYDKPIPNMTYWENENSESTTDILMDIPEYGDIFNEKRLKKILLFEIQSNLEKLLESQNNRQEE